MERLAELVLAERRTHKRRVTADRYEAVMAPDVKIEFDRLVAESTALPACDQGPSFRWGSVTVVEDPTFPPGTILLREKEIAA